MIPRQSRGVIGLLAILQVNYPKSRQGHFWRRPDLEWLLTDAKDNWRQLIKSAHPDRGGSHAQAALLNDAWARLQKLFAARGITIGEWHPLLRQPDPPKLPPPPGRPGRPRRITFENPLIPCACGCGAIRRKFSKDHRRRFFLQGHRNKSGTNCSQIRSDQSHSSDHLTPPQSP